MTLSMAATSPRTFAPSSSSSSAPPAKPSRRHFSSFLPFSLSLPFPFSSTPPPPPSPPSQKINDCANCRLLSSYDRSSYPAYTKQLHHQQQQYPQHHPQQQQHPLPLKALYPSAFNLRPKSHSSRRHRHMASTTQHSSASSSSPSSLSSACSSGSSSPVLSSQSCVNDDSVTSESLSSMTTTTTTTTTTTITTTTTTASSGRRRSASPEQGSSGPSFTGPLGLLVPDGPYLFVFDVALSLYYPIRALILFALGFAFSLIIDHLQTQHHLVEYPPAALSHQLFDTASWLPPTCGASAVLIGTIYPLGDYLWWGRREKTITRDWSSVMRCMGGFIGVNYAASKLPSSSSLQVSCTLALISLGLWFLFDRTIHGFIISSIVASMGTAVAYFLVLHGWYSFTKADFFGVGSWIPCILYSSSVCFGSIGRQLDVVPEAWYTQSQAKNADAQNHLKSE